MSKVICPNCGRRTATSQEVPKYHYRESGLENIWLRGGVTETRCEHCRVKTVRIEKEQQLLQVIAMGLLMEPRYLTGPEMRFIRGACQLTQAELAAALKLPRRETVADRERKPTTNLSFTEELGLRLILLKSFREHIAQKGSGFLSPDHRKRLEHFTLSLAHSAMEIVKRGRQLTAELDEDRDIWTLPESKAA